ncbi:unnamed protein product [Rotaria sp. Silwood1]|nr:unnamed protein product [Rotaria sp. Silwood1]CAF3946286.1 unnamed protein product [Rotaria sp. Silwood1]CAF4024845.1 unnamed protein product [Rotaria sp. Silwood1]CAF4979189.1 unnamed protein product [Rotaria sp. Silwood1]CAF5013227.1 unnamed protein product [Rotaria sp. Silwood1]
MTTKVVPHYQVAYRMLNDDIIQPILNFNDTFDEPEVTTENIVTVQQHIDETTMVEKEDSDEQTTQSTSSDDEEVEHDSESDTFALKSAEIDSYKDSIRREQHPVRDNLKLLLDAANTLHEELNDTISEIHADTNTTETVIHEATQPTTSEDRLKALVDKLRVATTNVYNNLKTASSECGRLRTTLNEGIVSTILAISKQEELCREVNTTIDKLTSEIPNQEQQVAFAEQVVRERQEAVARAEQAVRDAEDNVEKARLCRGKRRRRRFIGGGGGGWWNKVVEKPVNDAYRQHIEKPIAPILEQTIVKPVCSVINMEGIDRAKEAKSKAQDMLSDAQNRLNKERETLATKRSELSNAYTQRNEAEERRQTLNRELSELQSKYSVISLFSEQFLNVTTHISTVLGDSRTLNTEIKRLLDFELVIEPLNALAQGMVKDELMSAFGFEISTSTIATVGSILDRLAKRLESFPLIIQNEDKSAVVEHGDLS